MNYCVVFCCDFFFTLSPKVTETNSLYKVAQFVTLPTLISLCTLYSPVLIYSSLFTLSLDRLPSVLYCFSKLPASLPIVLPLVSHACVPHFPLSSPTVDGLVTSSFYLLDHPVQNPSECDRPLCPSTAADSSSFIVYVV